MDLSNVCSVSQDTDIGCLHIKIKNLDWDKKSDKEKIREELLINLIRSCTSALLYSQENNNDFFNVKVDASSIKFKHLDRKLIKLISESLQTLFPDKLNKCYIYNTTKLFNQFFDIIKLFIDKKTKQKIIIQ
jgi:hypothetical protein